MISLPENWMHQMESVPFWIIMNVQPSGKCLEDIRLLLFWFTEGSLTEDQLSDSLEEYEFHNDVRFALMAARHDTIAV